MLRVPKTLILLDWAATVRIAVEWVGRAGSGPKRPPVVSGVPTGDRLVRQMVAERSALPHGLIVTVSAGPWARGGADYRDLPALEVRRVGTDARSRSEGLGMHDDALWRRDSLLTRLRARTGARLPCFGISVRGRVSSRVRRGRSSTAVPQEDAPELSRVWCAPWCVPGSAASGFLDSGA